ncbi:MAG: DUF4303 domain-containing protein [Chloroflexi bacterium]|nr:DUF4303 domain-containing protein [Chloroflexota bacterium]
MDFDLNVEFNYDAFEQATYEAARVIFPMLQRERSDETFYTFNFDTGQLVQYVAILVNTEEELERQTRRELQKDDKYLDVPYADFKTFWRHHWFDFILVYSQNNEEFAKRFKTTNDMLWSLTTQLDELEDELLEDEDVDEDELYEYVFDNIHDPIRDRLARVLQRLDKEGIFELTNKRENIHLGLHDSNWPRDTLPGPFADLNPEESCRRYEQDKLVFDRVQAKLFGSLY